jgi:membrane protein DedA with SNARE-associated domain
VATVFDPVIDLAHELVEAGGYLGLGAAIVIESVFPPIPSEIILPLAGAQVADGSFSFGLALLAATAGSVLGALIIYAIARIGGRPLLMRYGRLLRISADDLDRADDWFDRRGGWIVLGGRLVPGARSLVSIPAGLSEMGLGRFVALTTLGSGLWNAALIGAGWVLGSNYEKVERVLGPASEVVGLLIGLAIPVAALWWWRRRHRT